MRIQCYLGYFFFCRNCPIFVLASCIAITAIINTNYLMLLTYLRQLLHALPSTVHTVLEIIHSKYSRPKGIKFTELVLCYYIHHFRNELFLEIRLDVLLHVLSGAKNTDDTGNKRTVIIIIIITDFRFS